MLLRDICVSYNMELFCRTNTKPRNALPVTLTVNSMVVLDSKSIADAMVGACRKLLRNLSGVKPPILCSVFIGTSPSDK